jgi:hypothetical protein
MFEKEIILEEQLAVPCRFQCSPAGNCRPALALWTIEGLPMTQAEPLRITPFENTSQLVRTHRGHVVTEADGVRVVAHQGQKLPMNPQKLLDKRRSRNLPMRVARDFMDWASDG